jgi:hypothetical protein
MDPDAQHKALPPPLLAESVNGAKRPNNYACVYRTLLRFSLPENRAEKPGPRLLSLSSA